MVSIESRLTASRRSNAYIFTTSTIGVYSWSENAALMRSTEPLTRSALWSGSVRHSKQPVNITNPDATERLRVPRQTERRQQARQGARRPADMEIFAQWLDDLDDFVLALPLLWGRVRCCCLELGLAAALALVASGSAAPPLWVMAGMAGLATGSVAIWLAALLVSMWRSPSLEAPET